MRFTNGNPEAHDYLEGLEVDTQQLARLTASELEQHYDELMRNVRDELRGEIETANGNPTDPFTVERRDVFAALCCRGLRAWTVRA